MNGFWIFLTIFLDVFPFIFLQYMPFRDKLKIPYKKAMLICTAVLFIQFLGFIWLANQTNYNTQLMLFYRFGLLITLFISNLIFVRENYAKVFFVFALMAPYVVVVITVGSFVSHYIDAKAAPLYMMSSLCRLLLVAISFPFFYLIEKKHLLSVMEIDDSIWRFALPVPVMFSLISLSFVDANYEYNGVLPSELFGMLFIFFGCIFTCFFLLKALKQVRLNTELTERENQSQWLLSLQTQQYDALSKNIDEAKVARHDLRHQLAAIKQLAEQGETEKLFEFVSSLVKKAAEPKELYISDNPVLSSIASYYMGIGFEQNIDVDFEFHLSDKHFCDDIDLCIIIGNLLENAIEASVRIPAEKRFIKLRAKIIDENFILTVDNSFDGIVLADKSGYFSRKRVGSQEKGIGLVSVFAVVNKYHGDMRVEHTKNMFMVSVLLPAVW